MLQKIKEKNSFDFFRQFSDFTVVFARIWGFRNNYPIKIFKA